MVGEARVDPGDGAIPKAEAAGGEAEARLCFGDGGGRDGPSVQLPSQRGAERVGIWVALGIPFARRTQASGSLRRNLFNLQICFNKVIFIHCSKGE